jgi:hypothetical protein
LAWSADFDDLLRHQRGAQLPGHRVHRAGATLAQGSDMRLMPQARSEVTDRQ